MSEFRTPTVRELLSEGRWLRRLLQDELPSHAVEDALQETWTRAMRGVPLAPAALRPWLRTVSRRVARAFRRGEGRRRDRERGAARSEALPSTDEVAERLDLQQRVTAVVRELPEPYRSTVLLRYYEDLDVREIARRFQTTTDNVYARLARARVMIRDRLPEEIRARVPLVLIPTAKGSWWLASAAVGVFAIGIGAWRMSGFGEPEPARSVVRVPEIAALAQPAPESGGSDLRVDVDRAANRDSVTVDAPTEGVAPRTATPASGLDVVVRPAPMRNASMTLTQDSRPAATVVVNARGRASFESVELGESRLALALEPSGMWFERRLRIEALGDFVEWQLGESSVEVVVHDHDGLAASGAFVWLSGGGFDVRAKTEPSGIVVLPMLPGGEYRLYVSIEVDDEKVTEEVRRIELGPAESARAVFGSPEGLPRWAGTLRAMSGEPVTGARPGDRSKLVLTHTETRDLVPVFVDSEGRFEVRLAGGTYRVLAFPHSCLDVYRRVADVTVSTREQDSDVVMPGMRLVVGAQLLDAGAADDALELHRDEDPERTHRTHRRADGTFVFDGVEAGSWTLSGARLREPRSIEVAPDAKWMRVEVVLQ